MPKEDICCFRECLLNVPIPTVPGVFFVTHKIYRMTDLIKAVCFVKLMTLTYIKSFPDNNVDKVGLYFSSRIVSI